MPRVDVHGRVHGTLVRVRADSAVIVAAAEELLAGFGASRRPESESPGPEPQALEIVLHTVSTRAEIPVPPPAAASAVKVVPEAGYTLYRDGAGWLVDFQSGGLLSLDLRACRATGWLIGPERHAPDWSGSFVLFALIELLRLRGLYTVHAAGLEKDGAGIMIAAPGGRGKTTACLALMRGGYRCLSDDHPLLRETRTGLELLPFPGRASVTDRTLAWFPELEAARGGFRREGAKQSFHPQDAFRACAAPACAPAVLVFPRIVDWPESALEPLPRSRALEELLPQTLLVLDRELAARQFRTFTRLVQTTRCYRLHFGEDIDALPALIGRVLGEAGAAGGAPAA